LDFAEVLCEHWPRYVEQASGPIPSRAWAAVEAVLSCRTARRGGHLHHCAECRRHHYVYHSCNHRACPRCGAREQAEWTRRQEARLLPVPYYLLTVTVPAELRGVFLLYPQEFYPLFFAAVAESVKEICSRKKHLGGDPGFSAILHTWTRRMFFHPHIHILIPAVALSQGGCQLRHPRNQEYLIPEKALAYAVRQGVQSSLKANHAGIFAQIEAAAWEKDWVAQCKSAGRGRTALRYLAAYVRKSAFSQERLQGHDKDGHLIMRYRDSADNTIKHEALSGVELIRRWLLHVLPKGLVRVRHYGWLSPAAYKAFLRVRFLLGLGPYRIPPALKSEPPRCPFCNGLLAQIARIAPQRGPPLCQAILKAAA
jgi:hypothetical protein